MWMAPVLQQISLIDNGVLDKIEETPVRLTGFSSILSRTPLSMSEICWRSGATHNGMMESWNIGYQNEKRLLLPKEHSVRGTLR
jgi:hypothetical protein